MNRLTAVFVAALAVPAALQAETPTCAPGRLMDASSVTAQGEKVYTIKLQQNEVIYTVEAKAGAASFDPLRLTNRESLTLCVADQKLTIRRNDGTELTTKVIRQVVESNY